MIIGQGGWARTSDLLVPSEARYQLRYTLIEPKHWQKRSRKLNACASAPGAASRYGREQLSPADAVTSWICHGARLSGISCWPRRDFVA